MVFVIEERVDVNTGLRPSCLHIPTVLEHLPKVGIVVHALWEFEGETHYSDIILSFHFRNVGLRRAYNYVSRCWLANGKYVYEKDFTSLMDEPASLGSDDQYHCVGGGLPSFLYYEDLPPFQYWLARLDLEPTHAQPNHFSAL